MDPLEPSEILELFNKFSGKEIPVHELFDSATNETLNVDILNQPEPVIEEMKKVAAGQGYHFRVCIPGKRITKEYNTNRINASIEKGADGKWRVSNKFKIG